MPWWGLAVSALTLALVIPRLGEAYLWSDEAFTGLLGARILKYGLPRVADGSFVIHWVIGDARNGIWIWDGWLQHYISAAGQAIFGQTAMGARVFHALIGALIPVAVYPLFRAMSSRRGVAEAAVLLTGLSVPFLLYLRQARYYPEGMLLFILLLRSYHAGLRSRPRATLALVICAVLLFHTNVLWFVIAGISLAFHLAILRPPAPVMTRLVTGALITALMVAPYAIWAKVWVRRVTDFGTPLGYKGTYFALAHLRHYILELNLHVAPIVLLSLGAAAASGRAHRFRTIVCLAAAVLFPVVMSKPHTAFELWVFAPLALLYALFAIGFAVSKERNSRLEGGWMPATLAVLLCLAFLISYSALSTYPFFRYMCPLLPILAFLLASALFSLFQRKWLAWSAVAIVLITNAFSIFPIRYSAQWEGLSGIVASGRAIEELRETPVPFGLPAPDMATALYYEGWGPEALPRVDLRFPLVDYIGEITHRFRGPIEAIVEYLNEHKKAGERFYTVYGAYPIAYHTGLVPQPYNPFSPPPHWFIPRETAHVLGDEIVEWLSRRPYREIVLNTYDTPYQNRPEPDLHRYRTAQEGRLVRIGRREK